MKIPERCCVYWGSHGCDLNPGHEGIHRCIVGDVNDPEICSEFEVTGPFDRNEVCPGRVRYDPESEWLESQGFHYHPPSQRCRKGNQ